MRRLTAAAFAVAFLWLCAMPSQAGPVPVTWTNPTEYVDDSALDASDIAQTRIEYGTCTAFGGFGDKTGEFVSLGNDTSEVSPNLAPGTYCFRAYTTANGVESAPSNAARAVVEQPAPKPPTLLDIVLAWIKRLFGRWA